MKNRGERREINKRKWLSQLKKRWESNSFLDRIRKVKGKSGESYWNLPKAESYTDFTKDRYGVMVKHTKTIYNDKCLTIQDERKRNLKNRSLSKEDKEELDRCLEDMNNPYAFENYCSACDNFETDECPFNGKVNFDTKWKEELNCDKFYD